MLHDTSIQLPVAFALEMVQEIIGRNSKSSKWIEVIKKKMSICGYRSPPTLGACALLGVSIGSPEAVESTHSDFTQEEDDGDGDSSEAGLLEGEVTDNETDGVEVFDQPVHYELRRNSLPVHPISFSSGTLDASLSDNEIAWASFIRHTITTHITTAMAVEAFSPYSLRLPEDTPSLWGRDSRLEDTTDMPDQWLSCYMYGSGLSNDMSIAEIKMKIKYDTFSGIGSDIYPFMMTNGKISKNLTFGGVSNWKRVHWQKAYDSFFWHYSGILLPGSRIIVGFWGELRPAGIFMLWVPQRVD